MNHPLPASDFKEVFCLWLQLGVILRFLASLVDLRTGQVVWFNRIVRGTGDLRESEPAAETLTALLAGFPL